MAEDDIFMRFLTLLIPLTIIFGGILCEVTAIRGKTGKGEHPRKQTMREEAFRKFRNNEIILGSIVSLGMIAFGGWLLYCWLFGPIER